MSSFHAHETAQSTSQQSQGISCAINSNSNSTVTHLQENEKPFVPPPPPPPVFKGKLVRPLTSNISQTSSNSAIEEPKPVDSKSNAPISSHPPPTQTVTPYPIPGMPFYPMMSINPALLTAMKLQATATVAVLKASSSGSLIADPNNDVNNWTEHKTDDGRRYWFNIVTYGSTFDKPLCLKTPEERSIPPCPWKECFAEGQRYYSDGKESRWEMPEEFRIWKERVEAAELKKALADPKLRSKLQSPRLSAQSLTSHSKHGKSAETLKGEERVNEKEDDNESITSELSQPAHSSLPSSTSPVPSLPKLSHTECIDAFKTLLSQHQISSSARLKDVQDSCQHDPRWTLLKTGERKQILAEYQTLKLKQEKEAQKIRSKRNREAFLLLLAESTDIDVKTTWREAAEALRDESRVINVEDPREREDLFKEFISELQKKEAEDRLRQRELALSSAKEHLNEMQASGDIRLGDNWFDHKDRLLPRLRRIDPRLKILDETDIRFVFVDLMSRLEAEQRAEQQKKREREEAELSSKQREFAQFLRTLSDQGIFKPHHKWRDFVMLPEAQQSALLRELRSTIKYPDGSPLPDPSEGGAAREVFEAISFDLREELKRDRLVFEDVLRECETRISPSTTFESIQQLFLDFSSQTLNETEGLRLSRLASLSHSLVQDRPSLFRSIFDDALARALEIQEEEARKARKREEKFCDLLRETFYKSDHLNLSWENARIVLDRYLSFEAIPLPDRQRLFSAHLVSLAASLGIRPGPPTSIEQEDSPVQPSGGALASIFPAYNSLHQKRIRIPSLPSSKIKEEGEEDEDDLPQNSNLQIGSPNISKKSKLDSEEN